MLIVPLLQLLFGLMLVGMLAAPAFVYACLRLRDWTGPERLLFAFIVSTAVLHAGWMVMMAGDVLSALNLHLYLWGITALQGLAVWRLWRRNPIKPALFGGVHEFIGRHKRIASGIITLAVLAMLRVIVFPEMMTDALSYHALKGLVPLQTGSWPQDGVGELIMNDAIKYYPGLANALQGFWFTLPGGVANNSFASLSVYLVFGVAIYALTRRLGASETGSALTTLVAMIAPIAFSLGTSGYVDLVAAIFPLVAIIFIPLKPSPHNLHRAALAALALGLGMAVRYNMIVPAAMLGMLAVIAALWQWARKRENGKRTLAALALMAICFFTMAMPQYAYNIAVTGNPLAPHQLDIGPIHLKGHYLPEQNAFGAYTGHVEPDFVKLPQYEQAWLAMLDIANYTWREHNWNGFIRVGWGNTLAFAVLPALLCFLILGRRRQYMTALASLAALYVLSIPYAMGEPRFHLLGGLILFPALGLFWDTIAPQKRLQRIVAVYLVLCVLMPQALMLLPANFGRNWIDQLYLPEYGDSRSPRAEGAVQLAAHYRPADWRVIVGPGASWGNNVYFYRRDNPLGSPVSWEMSKAFLDSDAAQDSKRKNTLVVCNTETKEFGDWCKMLSRHRDYVLVQSSGSKQLYATAASFENGGAE